MEGIIKIKESDLVLKVKRNYDPAQLDFYAWDNYLDCLCGTRSYQKAAINTVILYLASGFYSNINQLAKDNYISNSSLREKYKTCDDFLRHLPLPEKLSCVVDLATASGKSYVMYGIAQIMLSLGIVKRVLVLCPSVTIERELTDKFKSLAARKDLNSAVPQKYKSIRPSIIDASQTVSYGDICVENIHAIYDNVSTSIRDSFFNSGDDTLVLSDEVHHAYNTAGNRDIRKWKSFLLGSYGFKYLVGFTGTAYIGDEYFPDVIYRYSLRQAIEDKVVKSIEYVAKDDNSDRYEKFQIIYDNHQEIRRKNPSLKNLSIFVTKDIKSAERLCADFIDFLEEHIGLDKDSALSSSLLVTSSPQHKHNVAALQTVDDSNNPIEWIFSVSMLTEGWDVKNVFQIVPWEDRAFNSKLLISQVLGRGLRIPENCSTQPKVRVFNHASWSKSIQKLVDDVLEFEVDLKSRIILQGYRSIYNFDVHTLNYTQEERATERVNTGGQETFDLTKKVVLIGQSQVSQKITEYEDINHSSYQKTTQVKREMIPVDQVVNRIIESFKGRALEAKLVFPEGEYEKEKLPDISVIRTYIRSSMNACGITGDYLTTENANKIYGKFTGLLRRKPASPGFTKKGDSVRYINTKSMRTSAKSFSTLTKESSALFISNDYEAELNNEELDNFETISLEMKGKQIVHVNTVNMKTPLSIVFTQFDPELRFTKLLTSDDLSQYIDSWIKSRDSGFYGIDYQINKGSSIQVFNPDYFIKRDNNIAVVEIKSDNDDSILNCAKYKAAKRHFDLLNSVLEIRNIPTRYFLFFLSPVDFNTFSDYLKDGRLFTATFHSQLMELLEKQISAIDAN